MILVFVAGIFIVAEATGIPSDFTTYGIAGLVIAALLIGWLWTKPAVDRIIKASDEALASMRQRAEKAEAQRDGLMEVMTRDVIPALTANTVANQALVPVMQSVVKALDEVNQERPRTSAPRRRGTSAD